MSLCYPLLISRFSIFKFLCRRKPMSMSPEKSLLSYPIKIIERGKIWWDPEIEDKVLCREDGVHERAIAWRCRQSGLHRHSKKMWKLWSNGWRRRESCVILKVAGLARRCVQSIIGGKRGKNDGILRVPFCAFYRRTEGWRADLFLSQPRWTALEGSEWRKACPLQ